MQVVTQQSTGYGPAGGGSTGGRHDQRRSRRRREESGPVAPVADAGRLPDRADRGPDRLYGGARRALGRYCHHLCHRADRAGFPAAAVHAGHTAAGVGADRGHCRNGRIALAAQGGLAHPGLHAGRVGHRGGAEPGSGQPVAAGRRGRSCTGAGIAGRCRARGEGDPQSGRRHADRGGGGAGHHPRQHHRRHGRQRHIGGDGLRPLLRHRAGDGADGPVQTVAERDGGPVRSDDAADGPRHPAGADRHRLFHVQPCRAVRMGSAHPPVRLCRRGVAGLGAPDVRRLFAADRLCRAPIAAALLRGGAGGQRHGLCHRLLKRHPAHRHPRGRGQAAPAPPHSPLRPDHRRDRQPEWHGDVRRHYRHLPGAVFRRGFVARPAVDGDGGVHIGWRGDGGRAGRIAAGGGDDIGHGRRAARRHRAGAGRRSFPRHVPHRAQRDGRSGRCYGDLRRRG
eukprot:Opistho-2@33609